METFSFIARYNFASTHCTVVHKDYLYNDIYRYTVTNKTGCDNILAVIDLVKLSPLIYNSIFEENTTTDFTNIIEILTHYTSIRHNLEVSRVEVQILDDHSWNFIPYITLTDGTNSEIYVNDDNPDYDLDIYPLQNFKYLSTSQLTPYVHKKSSEPESTLINLEGVYLIQAKYETVVNEIKSTISRYEDDGYLILEDSPELDILSGLWNIKKIDSTIYSSEEFDEQWINNALLTVKSGQLPSYLVTGSWTLELTKSEQNQAFITYAFYVYYLGLISTNPSLLNYIEKIRVHKDLSIFASFGTYSEATGFKNPSVYNLQAIQFSTYEQAVRHKILLDHNNNLIILIIPIDDQFFLVWEGEIGNKSDNDIREIITGSDDHIIFNIISGVDLAYKKLYLSGILSTDITSGLITIDSIPTLEMSGNLIFDEESGMLNVDNLPTLIDLFPIGNVNNNLIDKINSLWKSGYFLSDWGITVYIYLGITDNMYLKISPQLLELEYKSSYGILSSLLP